MRGYRPFAKWLNNALAARLPNNTVAVNFNLYECGDSNGYQIELIASDRFDEHDDDWACSEIYTTRHHLLVMPSKESWDVFLDRAEGWIAHYIEKGKYREKLLGFQAVAVGFVDGDLHIVYRRTKRLSRFRKAFYWGVVCLTLLLIAVVGYLLFGI